MMITENTSTCYREQGSYKYHDYYIKRTGQIYNKHGHLMKRQLRDRRGGKQDLTVKLRINGKSEKFTVSRLVAACFIGPVYGLQVNHKDRDPLNVHVDNLEVGTASENQKHWRLGK